MPYASLEDVKRVLRVTGDDATRDAHLRASLNAIEAWIAPKLRRLDAAGPQIEVYWDVMENSTLYLPSKDAVVTKVKVFGYPGGWDPTSPTELEVGDSWEQDQDGRLILRPTLLTQPFSGAVGSRLPRRYAKVEVHYIATGVVPADVTEGVAILAAGYYEEGPAMIAGLNEEKIGDYSYKSSAPTSTGDTSWTARAMWFLGPHFNTARVSVI